MTMELSLSTLAAVSLVSLAVCWALHLRRRWRAPPGPVGLPLLGSLPMLMRFSQSPWFRWPLMLNELRRRYGGVMSVQFGTQEFVLLSGIDTIRRTVVERADVFSHRPQHPFYQLLAKGRGILLSSGELWREQRRFALRVLRDFGVGRSLSEQQIQAEAQELVQHLGQQAGGELDTKDFVVKAVINVIAGLVFDQRSGYEDPKLQEYLKHAAEMTQAGFGTMLLAMFPWVPMWLVQRAPGTGDFLRAEQWVMDYCSEKIAEVKRAVADSPDAEPSCYVAAYLREQHRRQLTDAGVGTFDDLQLVRTVLDLFLAGSDTTANTLRWALLYCSLYPQQQQLCHQEIRAAIGSRLVCMKDKKEMHRVQAFLDETQRLCALAPLAVDHQCPEDTEIDGRTISRDAFVLVNLLSVLHDPQLFPDPDSFDPGRFIDPDTGCYRPNENLIPFGIGRRACLGESLARMELFIFFVSLLQRLQFEPSDDCQRRREEIVFGLDGIVHAAGQHKLVVRVRDL